MKSIKYDCLEQDWSLCDTALSNRMNGTFNCGTLCLSLLILILAGCDSRKTDFQAFQTKVKQSINPQKLREWAIPIMAKHDVGFEITVEDLPAYVRIENGPSSAFVSDCDRGGKALFLTWGGGFGHRGLIIGDVTCVVENKYRDRQVIGWSPGIYFFDQ